MSLFDSFYLKSRDEVAELLSDLGNLLAASETMISLRGSNRAQAYQLKRLDLLRELSAKFEILSESLSGFVDNMPGRIPMESPGDLASDMRDVADELTGIVLQVNLLDTNGLEIAGIRWYHYMLRQTQDRVSEWYRLFTTADVPE